MPKQVAGLTTRKIETVKALGLYADGGGLYLNVYAGRGASSGREPVVLKSWIFRYTLGRRREMGLGPTSVLTLAQAREKARAAREMVAAGIDPLEARKASTEAAKVEVAKAITFKECAAAYIDTHKAGWRNEKHRDQWTATLNTYACPVFGDLPVGAVDTGLVMKVLEPIWATKTETASRLRQRIEAVIDWATVRGHRTGENPARWKGHLEALLPPKAKVAKAGHFPALPYTDMPQFFLKLQVHDGIGARALEFAILTAARTNEVLGATWGEIDLDARLWTVPGERMKGGKEHRVPLTEPALALLRKMQAISQEGGFVFPGMRKGRPLSNMAMGMVVRRMGHDEITPHGFRSAFKDWCTERTGFPVEVSEMALAHTVNDKVEAAYRRGDLFEKRRHLAEAWAAFCTAGTASKVVKLRS